MDHIEHGLASEVEERYHESRVADVDLLSETFHEQFFVDILRFDLYLDGIFDSGMVKKII
jgi:hypothetical protein